MESNVTNTIPIVIVSNAAECSSLNLSYGLWCIEKRIYLMQYAEQPMENSVTVSAQ